MKQLKIKVEDGIYLLMDEQCDNIKLMTAIGMLSQMYMCASLEHDKFNSKDKPNEIVKNMMNAFIDEIYEKLTEER